MQKSKKIKLAAKVFALTNTSRSNTRQWASPENEAQRNENHPSWASPTTKQNETQPSGLGIDRSRYANIGMTEFTEERPIPKPSVFCLLFLAM